MTQRLHKTRAKWSNSLIESFVRLRTFLIDLGGSHVAIGFLIACNLMFGIYLLVARQTLFGPPATDGFAHPAVLWSWNKFVSSSDSILILLAAGLILTTRAKLVGGVLALAVASATAWCFVWALAWISFVTGHAPLSSICITGVIPVGASFFVFLRVSADSSDLTENSSNHGGEALNEK